MAHRYYLSHGALQSSYGQIQRPDSAVEDVDVFWQQLLPVYFKQNFQVRQGSRRLLIIGKGRTTWTVSSVKNGAPRARVIVVNDRNDKASSPAEWGLALEQLNAHLTMARTEAKDAKGQTYYGLINIGTYTRFYQLAPGQMSCVELPGTVGKYHEAAKDAQRIHELLTWMAETTSR